MTSSYAGASSNLGHLLFEANGALLEGGGELEQELVRDVEKERAEGMDSNNLYDSAGGRLHLVNVLPNGTAARAPRSAHHRRRTLAEKIRPTSARSSLQKARVSSGPI